MRMLVRTLRVGAADAMLADDGAAIEARVRERLATLGVEHEIVECDPDFADTAAFCARYGVPREQAANTIVVAARARIPRSRARASFSRPAGSTSTTPSATCSGYARRRSPRAEQTRELTGMMIGGVTPFGLDRRPAAVYRCPRDGTGAAWSSAVAAGP